MEGPFSPSRSDAFHFSPTHLRHVDPMQELRNLRRSMSRSPSKLNKHTRSPLATSPAQTPRSPLVTTHNAPSDPTPVTRQRTTENESSKNIAKNKPALVRATPIRGLFKMPKAEPQPNAAALTESTDFGNSSSSSQEVSEGQENRSYTPSHSPPDTAIQITSKPKTTVVPFRTPVVRTRPTVSYDLKVDTGSPAKSSPLKRNDGAMKAHSSSLGSPSAKRRSLHGVPYEIAHDLANITTKSQNIMYSDNESDAESNSLRNTVARAQAGTRRSHLQQRPLQKAGANRNRRSLEITFATPSPARRTSNRNKPRNSLDNASPSQAQCEAVGQDNNPAAGFSLEHGSAQHIRLARQHPHPLSRTLTPSCPSPDALTSQNGASNEGSAYVPSARPTAFSKSLPIGALRPGVSGYHSRERRESPREEESYETPRFFNIAKPDPAAFRSTGLISKRHRNPDDMPPPQTIHADVPDTPCKKTAPGFYASPSPNPASHNKTASFGQPAFGTPSRPFDLHPSHAIPNSFSKSIGLFGNNAVERRVSFTSNDGEDAQSPSHVRESQGDSQSSADELPPTPTRHASSLFGIKPNSLRSSLFGRRSSVGPSTFVSPPAQDTSTDMLHQPGKSCDSEPLYDLGGEPAGTSEKSGPSGVAPSLDRFKAPSSFSRSRPQRRITGKIPSPLSSKAFPGPVDNVISSVNYTKQCLRSPVPLFNARSIIQSGPQTPADNAFPDPSALSISPSYRHSLSSVLSRPPETPTSHRDSGQSFFNSSVMTPHQQVAPYQDIDQVLKNKFKKVEYYAKGEFSEVYKVYQSAERSATPFASPANSFRAVPSQLPDRVYVVKKSKAPHTSFKLRARKLREASIMKSLGRSDHTVELIDSWEANYHFYLQMEYCEEGSLDGFLLRQGRDGRLDDFRIWKIMVELASVNMHCCASMSNVELTANRELNTSTTRAIFTWISSQRTSLSILKGR